MDVAEFVGTHSLLKTATAAKLFPMIFDSATRKEAIAAMVALGDVGAWAETEEARKAIGDTLSATDAGEVAEVLAGLGSTDPMVPAVGAIGTAIIRHLADSGEIATADAAYLGVMLKLLVKAPDVGPAQDRFIELTRANPEVAGKVALGVLHDGVKAEADVAGSVVVTLLGSSDEADMALSDNLITVMKEDAAPLVLHALLKAPRLTEARTKTYIGHLKRWKKPEILTGPVKVLVTDSESEPRAKVQVLLCREVVPPRMPDADTTIDLEEDDDEGKKKKKPDPKLPEEEPKMSGCIKKPETTDKEGNVAFKDIPIGIWYAVTKNPGAKKWATETVTTRDKDSEVVEPAWRCENAPETGCEMGVVVR